MTDIEVQEWVYNLTDNNDLREIEKVCGSPDKYKIIVDETIMIPFRHMRYEKIKR